MKPPSTPTFVQLWKAKCQPKHKLFFGLLLHDRFNIRDVLRRTMELDFYTCENCIQLEKETWDHFFLKCSFAKRC